jgi:hypothetical protein
MEPWRAVEARYGDVEGQIGAMEGRERSQWRRGGSKKNGAMDGRGGSLWRRRGSNWSHGGP